MSAIVEDFKTKTVETTKGFFFSQYQTINRINLYINDRFLERNDDAIFWNISTPRIPHFAKNIDLDTKDLMPYGEGDVGIFEAYCLRLKLRQWLNDNHFAITLNDLSEGLATYGSAVWKRCVEDGETKIEEVDLRNLYFDPTVKYIKKANVVEMHYLSSMEIKEREDVWDNVDKAIKICRKTSSNGNDIQNTDVQESNEIWEFWGQVEMEDGSFVYKHCIGAGYGNEEVLLLDEDVNDDDFPYYDFHIGKYRGTWLRMGVVQRLFRLQERANTVVNENAQATSIASLLLLRTQDPNTTGNVLQGALNGQIINSADLQQIGIDNRAFTMLLNELASIERQADLLCMTPEVIMGENSPSGTPFRTVAVTTNAAKSSFRYIKERVGETIGYILEEDILPQQIKKWNKGEVIELMEDSADVEMYDKWLKDKILLDQIKAGAKYTPELENVIQAEIDKNIKYVGRKLETQKGMFDKKYRIKFNISGEAYDKAQMNDAYFNAIQMVMANPAILDLPLMRQYLENNGISWWKLTPKQKQDLTQMSQAMGKTQPTGQVQGQPIQNPEQANSLSGSVDSTQ